MKEIFVSQCNESELHALFQRLRTGNESELHALFQRLRTDPVKHRQYFRNPRFFGFRAADVASAVVGNADNNPDAWGMGQKLPLRGTQCVLP
jgi:hypothetical protein